MRVDRRHCLDIRDRLLPWRVHERSMPMKKPEAAGNIYEDNLTFVSGPEKEMQVVSFCAITVKNQSLLINNTVNDSYITYRLLYF